MKAIKQLMHFAHSSKFNLNGLTSGSKYVIIESDDWGAIRTPSKEVARQVSRTNESFANSYYKNDALASFKDLEFLFEVLLSKTNREGKHPVLTANVITANPDFKKIRESEFQAYFYEPVDVTFSKLDSHRQNIDKWHEGIGEGIFRPQFHGREHLNVSRWMNALHNDLDETRKFFDLGMTYSGIGDYSYMEAFDWTDPKEQEAYKEIIADGLKIFKRLFGELPNSFIAPCYNWDDSLEKVLYANNIGWMQGIQNQLVPTGAFNRYHRIKHSHGKTGPNGLRYSIRNVFFEPSLAPNNDWVNNALARISNAFMLKKPAVICSHRINYVGYIDEKNRDRNLKLLSELLDRIIKKWPDVQFVSSGDYNKVFDLEN